MWYKAKVLFGSKSGRTIGFPTVNLDPDILIGTLKEGIYACQVEYESKMYKGALYLGPRLVKGEKNAILEIHIINFKKDIYGQEIEFNVGKFIREIIDFKSMQELKSQIEKDILMCVSVN
ncbi:riboflavin kinase [Candidatus Roizmanbacteria bacterium]|nr:riboflavin kinase [Candidatus Roizmanbacteria bacterium]